LGKKLYITEKPSVAASFAEVLGMKITKQDRSKDMPSRSTQW